MNNSILKILKIRDVKTPRRWTEDSSWIDFFVPKWLFQVKETPLEENPWWSSMCTLDEKNKCFHIQPWRWILIPSWIKTIIKKWYDLSFENKSWVSIKKWFEAWANVIDSDYRWEIHLHVINISDKVKTIKEWEKIIQAILRPVILEKPDEITEEEFNKFSDTERGEWGFWSTWNK